MQEKNHVSSLLKHLLSPSGFWEVLPYQDRYEGQGAGTLLVGKRGQLTHWAGRERNYKNMMEKFAQKSKAGEKMGLVPLTTHRLP